MALTPIAAFLLISVFAKKTAFVFFVEVTALWAFAAYWYTKSRELKKSGAIRKALGLHEELENAPDAPPTRRVLVAAAGVAVAGAVLVGQFKLIQPTFEGTWRVVEVTTPDGVTTTLPGSEIYTFFAPRQYAIVRFTPDSASFSGTYQLVDGILTLWPPEPRIDATKPFSRVSLTLRESELTMADLDEQNGQPRNGNTRKLVRVR